jgi:hypothetical protein
MLDNKYVCFLKQEKHMPFKIAGVRVCLDIDEGNTENNSIQYYVELQYVE